MTEEKQKNDKESPKSLNKGAKARFERESMVVYKTFFNVIMSYKDENLRLLCFVALFEYGLNGIEPEADDSDVVKTFIAMAKPLIDRNIARYDACKENGKKGAKYGALGGAPKGNKNNRKSTKSQPDTQPNKQPKVNLNDNVNDNDNVNENVNVLSERDITFDSLSQKEKNIFLKYKTFNINSGIDTSKYDLNMIEKALEKSDYLQRTNMTFIIKHYDDVINGNYENFSQPQTSGILTRTLTESELENMTSMSVDWENVEL
mgnify:CR=1 FL=1